MCMLVLGFIVGVLVLSAFIIYGLHNGIKRGHY